MSSKEFIVSISIAGEEILVGKMCCYVRGHKSSASFKYADEWLHHPENLHWNLRFSSLKELWRRIVFTIMVSNTDNHLRNYGFIYERYKGWRLSPVYDINPTPIAFAPRILSTAIDFEDH